MRFTYTLTAVTIAASLALPTDARAHGGVTLSGRGTATIDGALAPGEWNEAAAVDFAANTPTGPTPARMYVMNDDADLYLAIRVARPGLDTSSPVWEFDNDHDGTFFEEGDDVLVLNAHAGFFDDYRTMLPPCPPGVVCGPLDTFGGGTIDGVGVARNDGTHTTYELSHPLDSGDEGHDFNLDIGDTVGFFSFFRICAAGGCFDTRVAAGDIVIAGPADRTPPETTIDAAPEPLTSLTGASVAFSGSDDVTAAGALAFECSLDGVAYGVCTSPLVLADLAEGAHTLLVRARDAAGNVDLTPAEARWTVDTTPPSLTVAVDTAVLWPPNHRLVPVAVDIDVSDANGATAWLAAVSSDEPDDATGDGVTAGDVLGAELGTLDELVLLRAERAGDGNGRVYTLAYAAEDAAGNRSTTSVEVVVPHRR